MDFVSAIFEVYFPPNFIHFHCWRRPEITLKVMQFWIFRNFEFEYFCIPKVTHPYLSIFWIFLIGMYLPDCALLLFTVGTRKFWQSKLQKKAFFRRILYDHWPLCKQSPTNIYVLKVSLEVVEHEITVKSMGHFWRKEYYLIQIGMFFLKKRPILNFDPPKL